VSRWHIAKVRYNGGMLDLDHRSGRAPREPLRLLPLLTLLTLMLAAATAASCSAAGPSSSTTTTSTTTGTGGGGAGGEGGDGGGDLLPGEELTLLPQNPILLLDLPVTQTVPFSCVDKATQQPVAATWTLSTPDLGAIASDGVFTPNGKLSGDVTVECASGDATASTTLKIILHVVEGEETVPQSDIDILKGGAGLSDQGWNFLYPYDETVFPRGILPPEIHLSPGSAGGSTYHVHILVPGFEYEGFFQVSGGQPQLKMSQEAWDALTTAAAGQKITVQVSKLAGGQKYGPITRKWILAKGKLHGVIHYESYDTQIAGNPGAILRIKGSSSTPEVLLDNCNVCHSLSADGSTAVTAGGVFDLSGGNINPPSVWSGDASFAAVYPKQGSVILRWYSGFAQLQTKGGDLISNSGIEPYAVQAASFSVDGTKLAFWDSDIFGGGGNGLLAMLDYDEANQKFSNYQILANISNQPVTTWPAFTPDGKTVVFQTGTTTMTGGGTGRLLAVDVQTKQLADLLKLNGDGYMPAGPRDENLNFEPTIAPLASGGYFWVTFTSRRTYGNKLTGPAEMTKRLWIAAIDINAPPGADPSHPAFYVAGQEQNAGNSRGFWTLDACKEMGASCETGDECCEGGCIADPDTGEKVCGTPQGCSNEFDACTTSADCCDAPGLECIGGKCALAVPD
jgi:hypothetical protein